MSRTQRSMLMNSDIFLNCSETKTYFYDQKRFNLKEIDRLSKVVAELEFGEEHLKTKLIMKDTEILNTVSRYEKTIENYRRRDGNQTTSMTNTDIDNETFQKYVASYEILHTSKRLVIFF